MPTVDKGGGGGATSKTRNDVLFLGDAKSERQGNATSERVTEEREKTGQTKGGGGGERTEGIAGREVRGCGEGRGERRVKRSSAMAGDDDLFLPLRDGERAAAPARTHSDSTVCAIHAMLLTRASPPTD